MLYCYKCKTTSPRGKWIDDGTCSEGCCDRYICPNCKCSVLFEVGD